jgi:hypothetical protein
MAGTYCCVNSRGDTKRRCVNKPMDPYGDYITHVIRVKNQYCSDCLHVHFLLVRKEVLGEPLPYLRSTRSPTGANSLYNTGTSFLVFACFGGWVFQIVLALFHKFLFVDSFGLEGYEYIQFYG